MIYLDVKDYCHTCPDFEAHTTMLYNDDKAESIYVSCAHRLKCERLYEHIKDKERKADADKFNLN